MTFACHSSPREAVRNQLIRLAYFPPPLEGGVGGGVEKRVIISGRRYKPTHFNAVFTISERTGPAEFATLAIMPPIVQVRTFALRCGQAIPAVLRVGQVPPSPAIAGLAGGDAPLARLRSILAGCGMETHAQCGIDIRPAQREAWAGLDLPLAVALLVAEGLLPRFGAEAAVFAGAISGGGHLGPVEGIEAIAVQTAGRGLALFCGDCQAEAAASAGSGEVFALRHLADLVEHFTGDALLVPAEPPHEPASPGQPDGMAERAVPFRHAQPPAVAEASIINLPTAALPFPSTGPYGHRGRMRERVLDRGTAGLADYELLEMLLFLAFQRGDTKPLAKQLINQFGSLAAVLSATGEALLAVHGVNGHVATMILAVREAAERMGRAELRERPLLQNWDRLISYLNTVLAHEPVEHFRVLFLDTRNRLLADEAQARGTVNHTPVYPREVMKRALELQATALILVHNHPSGDPAPSKEDIAMTREVRRATEVLNIVLHDHIIIGAGGWCSLRQQGLL